MFSSGIINCKWAGDYTDRYKDIVLVLKQSYLREKMLRLYLPESCAFASFNLYDWSKRDVETWNMCVYTHAHSMHFIYKFTGYKGTS